MAFLPLPYRLGNFFYTRLKYRLFLSPSSISFFFQALQASLCPVAAVQDYVTLFTRIFHSYKKTDCQHCSDYT